MTREECIKWLKSLKTEIGKSEHGALWHYAEAIDTVIKALSAEAVQGWIPCSERLPCEKDGRVLVTKRGEVMTARYSEFSGTWYVGEMCAVGGEDPIAWMPLPKPYREDGE